MWPALLPLAVATTVATATPRLNTDTSLATAGYYTLHWTADTPTVMVEAHTPNDADATIVYTGADRATVLSGQPNGTRIYRAGEIGADGNVSAWSEPVSVTVAHHPLSRALTFFAVGALVFIATLVLIVRGARSCP